jgi:outer membrane protein TolC
LAAALNEALARARRAALRAAGARERLRLARTVLLPQARQAYASALAGYQGGKEGFAAVLDAYRGELSAREGAVSDAAAALIAEADLEEAAGPEAVAAAREGEGK